MATRKLLYKGYFYWRDYVMGCYKIDNGNFVSCVFVSTKKGIKNVIDNMQVSHIQFTGTTDQTCSHFGCGRVLTPEQKLYGSHCTQHSGTAKETVSNYLMSKIKNNGS